MCNTLLWWCICSFAPLEEVQHNFQYLESMFIMPVVRGKKTGWMWTKSCVFLGFNAAVSHISVINLSWYWVNSSLRNPSNACVTFGFCVSCQGFHNYDCNAKRSHRLAAHIYSPICHANCFGVPSQIYDNMAFNSLNSILKENHWSNNCSNSTKSALVSVIALLNSYIYSTS